MTKPVSYDASPLPARIWLHVAVNGWCNFHEVALNLAETPCRVKTAMLQMARHGQLAKKRIAEAPEDAPTKIEFGVMRDSKLPMGLRLDMVLRAVAHE